MNDLMRQKKLSEIQSSFRPFNLTAGKGKELFFNGECVQDENGKIIPEGDGFINICYNKSGLSKMLSNLFPYEFSLRGEKASSIEGVLQGIKSREAKLQRLVFKYHGMDALNTRAFFLFDDWRNTQTLHWQEVPVARNSKEYQDFLDELYIAASGNPLFERAIKAVGSKSLLHTLGGTDASNTVLTRNEFESRLNSLKEIV